MGGGIPGTPGPMPGIGGIATAGGIGGIPPGKVGMVGGGISGAPNGDPVPGGVSYKYNNNI